MRRRIRKGGFMMPRVHRVTKSGRVFKYHRITRAPLPADVPEDSPAFIDAWRAQEAGTPKPRRKALQGTVEAGCQAFLASRSFLDLGDGYRAIIRRHAEQIALQGRDAMIRDLRPQHIEQDLEPLSPAVASARKKAWNKMVPFWRTKGWIDENVAAAAKGKRQPKTDGHTEWGQNDLEIFRRRWPIGTAQRLAFEVIQWTGARCVDAVRLGPGMVQSDGLLRLVQSKTNAEVNVPWTAAAFGLESQRADLMKCLRGHPHMIFIVTKYGKPRSVKAVSQWFSQAATDAGLHDLSAHGLRKYRMNQLAEAGAPVLAMQTWVGHTTLKEVERYIRRASRRKVFFVNQPKSLQNGGASD